MLSRHSIVIRGRTATTLIMDCFGFVFLSVLAIVWFSHDQMLQAQEYVVPSQRNHSRPANVQPNVAEGYGKLPLGFEANRGQTDPRVRFLARGRGYTISLADDEAVLTLKKPPLRANVAQHPLSGAAAFHDLLSWTTPREKAENGVEKPRDRRAGSALPFSTSPVADSSASGAAAARGTWSSPPNEYTSRMYVQLY